MNNIPTKNGDRDYYLLALRIAGDFGATIAVPVVLLAIIGRKMDNNYDSGIIFTLIGFVLAAIISGIIIYKKAKRYGKEYQNLVDSVKK